MIDYFKRDNAPDLAYCLTRSDVEGAQPRGLIIRVMGNQAVSSKNYA